MLHVVPRLTDPSRFTPNLASIVDLDERALLAIADIDTNPFRSEQAIFFVPTPGAADDRLEDIAAGGYKTILVVIGSSAKGLGASGITIDQEVDRLHAIMEKAKELNIQVIAAHIEGKARRGKPGSADERSIDAILPYAAHIVVNKDGDLDKKFTRFGEEHSIPVSYLDLSLIHISEPTRPY